jgi:hypothetical protein
MGVAPTVQPGDRFTETTTYNAEDLDLADSVKDSAPVAAVGVFGEVDPLVPNASIIADVC